MALRVTTSLVEDSAAGLAAGGWRYTQRQLYYATCARAEIGSSDAASNGEIGLGVLLILVGLTFIAVKVVFALFVTLGVALVLAGILGRMRRPNLTGRLLAVSFDEFRSRFGPLRLEGLISPDTGPASAQSVAAPVTIVSDTPDTAAMIAANAERAELGSVRVIPASQDGMPGPGTRVVVLHDASPRGVALVQDLRDSGVEVVDGGLRPREVAGASHQVIEGAPARLPRDLSMLLDGAEIDWLLSGRRVELATLPPEVALDRVRAAISQAAPLPGDARQPAH
jgi:hypothetical protein